MVFDMNGVVVKAILVYVELAFPITAAAQT